MITAQSITYRRNRTILDEWAQTRRSYPTQPSNVESAPNTESRKIQQSCSPSLTLNDENRFVVDLILFSNLQSMFVTFFGVL